jgi:hypothetical protein
MARATRKPPYMAKSAVCEPQYEGEYVESEGDGDEAKESGCEAHNTHHVAAHAFCEGGGEGGVEWLRAFSEFLVEHGGDHSISDP